ncbi:predicted protein [Lichtheimia corymbifera JMRC:FSU:9682]|uniref:Uncharacterized protein n=1 Tax=Lichtheimia corymbifera JMRC:FSU:9682 TaxID=1263082 RepID=A0A068RHJ4_9FUNG|nr:predicted protein [Lichtheimia corymbifera JMRC:FSU:9682]
MGYAPDLRFIDAVCIFLGLPTLNLKLGEKVHWVVLITSIHLKIADFTIKILNAGDPNVMPKIRSTLHKPEIVHLAPETFIQGTFHRDEQFRPHKDTMLHYEDFEWQRPNVWTGT